MANKIIGTTEWFAETGSEGVCWAVHENGKIGYDGLNFLDEGDYLTIWNENGSIVFRGKIQPNYRIGYQPYPMNPKLGQPCALGFWIHWTQKDWQPDDWARLFIRDVPLRAELIKR